MHTAVTPYCRHKAFSFSGIDVEAVEEEEEEEEEEEDDETDELVEYRVVALPRQREKRAEEHATLRPHRIGR